MLFGITKVSQEVPGGGGNQGRLYTGNKTTSDLMKWVSVKPTVLYIKALAFQLKGREAYVKYQPCHENQRRLRTAWMKAYVVITTFIIECGLIMVKVNSSRGLSGSQVLKGQSLIQQLRKRLS